MSTLPVQLFGFGATAADVFNAIATFFATDSFADMLWLCGTIAVILTWARFMLTRDHKHLLTWAVVYVALPMFLLVPKTSIIITDASQPGVAYTVDHVPMGVAFPAYIGTAYMVGLTRAIESIFHTPDDQSYTRTGMLFGSKLYRLSTSIGIQDAELSDWWSQYLRNCIRKDITINRKYTWDEFAHASDLWAFLKAHNPSPVRRIATSPTTLETCAEVLPKIQARFDQQASQSLPLLATRVYGGQAAQQQAFLNTALQNSYQHFHHISQSATHIMRQNMAINAVRAGLMDSAARANSPAAAMNYAYTQTQMQSLSMWASIGLQAQEFLPTLQTILLLLILCSSILVLAVAFIPGLTATVLVNYLKGILYLGTWPILFAFIHFIMSTALANSTTATTDLYGGLTLSNANALEAAHIRFAAITGWLMMAVPMITPFIIRGGASIMGSLSHQFAGMVNSVAGRTSAAVASGDLALGNTQIDNHSWNNLSANKHDTSHLDRQYGHSIQRDDGSMVTEYGNHTVYSATGAISTTGFNINSGETQTRLLQQSVSNAQRASEHSRTAFSESVDASSDQLYQWSQSTSQNQQISEGTQSGVSTALNEAASTIQSSVQEYAKQYGITESEAASELTSRYYGADGSIGGNLPKLFGVLAGGKVSGGYRSTTDHKDGISTQDSENERQAASYQAQFNEAVSVVKQHAAHLNTQDTHSQSDQTLLSVNDHLRRSESLGVTAASEYGREQSLSAALQAAQNNTLATSSNLMPEFQTYIEQREPAMVETLMNGNTPELRMQREAYAERFLAQRFADYDHTLASALTDQATIYQPTDFMQSRTAISMPPNAALSVSDAQQAQMKRQQDHWSQRQSATGQSLHHDKRQYFDQKHYHEVKKQHHEQVDITQQHMETEKVSSNSTIPTVERAKGKLSAP